MINHLDMSTLNSSRTLETSLFVNKNSSGDITAEAGLSDKEDTSTRFLTAYEWKMCSDFVCLSSR